MAPIALINKKILACRRLYLNNSDQANLASYIIGTITSLPRSGRTSYLINWDETTLNDTIPRSMHNQVTRIISNNPTNRELIYAARRRYEASSSPRLFQNSSATSNSESSRLLPLQQLMTSPIQRRSQSLRINEESDSSTTSSEEGVELFEDVNIVDGSNMDIYDDVSDDEENQNEVPPEEEPNANNELNRLVWRFDEVESSNESLRNREHMRTVYNDKTTLREGVATSFTTPLEAFQVVGGFDYNTVKRLCYNSNEYMRRIVIARYDNGLIYGQPFVDISVAEMMIFLGINLRISLNPIDCGGYESYFSKEDMEIHLDDEETISAFGTGSWASDFMDLRRYKIIRMAFHPEDRSARECGDKCYHVRHLLRQFKAAAKGSFIPGRDIAFDEGGVASRHRLNPIRMYNKNKPQKFRVDFFLCSTTEPNRYIIMHLDIYQEKNARNVDIHPEAVSLGTTMKAVVNAVCQLDLANDPKGSRIFALDNR